MDKITAAGASLVAITPELPDQTLSTVEKHALAFDVLSDAGNDVAHQFGLVFTLPESTHDFYRSAKVNLPGTQGNDRFELPVTGTYIVGEGDDCEFGEFRCDRDGRAGVESDLSEDQWRRARNGRVKAPARAGGDSHR